MRASCESCSKTPEGRNGYGIRDIAIKPLEWAATENDFFMAIAKDAPRGSYPKPFMSEQSYWTVVGVDRDSAEALINEEGMIEVGRGQFSIEPFLYADGKLITWNDVKTSVASSPEALPLPQVTWSAKDLDLTINAFAAGAVGFVGPLRALSDHQYVEESQATHVLSSRCGRSR